MTEPYLHRVKYYETDMMAIVHHSNYIRWFEEGRVDYMRKNSIVMADIESQGVQIPVTGVSCDYKLPARFDDEVAIHTRLTAYNGIRMTFTYEVYRLADNKLLVTGESRHCFIQTVGFKPITLKRSLPDTHQYLLQLLAKDSSRTED